MKKKEKAQLGKEPSEFLGYNDIWDAFVAFCRSYRDYVDETLLRFKTYYRRFMEAHTQDHKVDLGYLDRERLNKYLTTYAEENKIGSQKKMQFFLRVFLMFCESEGLIKVPLSGGLPSIRRYRLGSVPFYLSEENIQKILQNIDCSNPTGMRDHLMLHMLANYGVRGIHIRKLKLEDVSWESSQIHFPPVKKGNVLTVPLLTGIGNELIRYLQEARPESPDRVLFLNDKGNPFRKSQTLTLLVAKHIRSAGVQIPERVPIGSHLFRNSLASRMLDHEVPFKQIADTLGHRDLNSTFIYTKIDQKKLREACLEWPEVVS